MPAGPPAGFNGSQAATRAVLNALAKGLNHLLAQHPNARARLASFQGRRIRIGADVPDSDALPAPELWYRIDEHGVLQAEPAGEADVQLLIKPSLDAGTAMLRDGVHGLSAHLRVEGDVMLAALLGEVIQELRWDFEDDLSRVVGDIPARRIGAGLNRTHSGLNDLNARILRQLEAVLATKGFSDLAPALKQSDRLACQETIDSLEARLDQLERRHQM